MGDLRTEHDLLGSRELPAVGLSGIHTLRGRENFGRLGGTVHPELLKAFGAVKLACCRTNAALGDLSLERATVLESACRELMDGAHLSELELAALQGGAGTSTNMAVNEVLANRALVLLGEAPGRYDLIHPLDHVNLHQSTNDTYPTALRIAALRGLQRVEAAVLALQEGFQAKEKAFAHVVKVGRTQLQDAVLTTLGREMGAYAEALNRDRWRLAKSAERLRVVNLGGTAIGTGLAAPRDYIFRVVDALKDLTGLPLARAENLVEATQNADVFVEVSGLLKALASNLLKLCSDLRLLASGPEAGMGELRLPPRQAGSSIMPGKVNPVIPEAATQAALMAMGLDGVIAHACGLGSLELNPFLPLVADALLRSLDLMAEACGLLLNQAVADLEADEDRCRAQVEAGTAAATALLPLLGYEAASALAARARASGCSIRDQGVGEGLFSPETFAELTSPEAVNRLGMRRT